MLDSIESYNRGVEGYQKATKRDLRRYAYEPTVLKYLPDIHGKILMDMACGEGGISEMFIKAGARKLIGIDNVEKQIIKAKERNSPNIEYHVYDAINDLSRFGKFDVVTAIMFLHYMKTQEEIQKSIHNIGNVLDSGGIFYTLTVNPKLLREGYERYGVRITSKSQREGSKVKTELCDFDWNKFLSFPNYYWSKETYNNIFHLEGFDVKWNEGIVSDEGIDRFGEKFWEKYLENPIYFIITATKR